MSAEAIPKERMSMRILNFHDLGEDGNNACYKELIKYWDSKQIVSHTYDLATENPAAILLDSMVYGPYDLIVGTGFGGVLALLAGRATGVRTVLVNPMCPIQRYLPAELPNYEYGGMLAGYEHGKICWDKSDRPSLRNVFLILGRDDDITDTARTPAYFHEGNSRFVEGGHFPVGEDFVQAFGELAGGIALAGGEPTEETDSQRGDAAESSIAGEGGLVIEMKAVGFDDEESNLERFKGMRIDEVDASDGHIVIRWSLPGEEPEERALYLYYADGKWRRDEEDGFSSGEGVAALVLKNASEQIIAQTEQTKHEATDFWGWMW